MKKYLLLALAVCGVCACTTPEEDAQIKLFWMEQIMQVMPKSNLRMPNPQPQPSVVPQEEQTPVLPDEIAAQPQETSFSVKTSVETPKTATAKTPKIVEAMLFVSPSCPRCQRLKQDRWADKFQAQYQGKIRLTEYDLSISKNDTLLQNMMRKYKLSQVSYPTLFIAGHVVQGYPLNADPVVKQVLAKQGWDQVAQASKHQFMEITLEDTNRRVNRVKSNAPLKERQAMQRAIERVKQSNQQALQDIGIMFDGDTQAQAFSIVSRSEKLLLRTANTSMNYQNYLNAQQKILQDQETQLNQLMRANAYKLRRVRG